MPTYSIQRVFGGDFRRAVQHYIATNHYMRSSGGSGQLFAVMADDEVAGACLVGATSSENQTRSLIAGACLIGPAGSQDAERSIATGVLVRQIKRLVVADDVPSNVIPESKLLRHAMREVTDEYGVPVLFVAYADQAATDLRTGHPLPGWVYLAAGFFYAGATTSRRSCCIDHHGAARNTRQGEQTISRRNLPRAGQVFQGEHVTKDWRMAKLPPARIWLAVVTPSSYTKRQAKHAWRAAWASLDPRRRVAARQWISHVAWRRAQAAGVVAIGEPRPRHLRRLDRFQPAWWRGQQLTRTAAPVWVPFRYQQRMLLLDDVLGEATAGRAYAPLISGEGDPQ
ncbi:hypothetical protein K2Z83_15590 [Oscillochloris sp. ZM17-4]|uniref:Mom family adenine methylcarbamoylation protein n=1 Tax=Oscillochloris sp. ZM17-4 TaxID=2866714 RepID=UPI001C733029|nr:hypothetical protein [Oscillochloris sp. ZM17-4]MBX0329100.1 hypothetical protein [Oscillochloris sp. ZM17-4]